MQRAGASRFLRFLGIALTILQIGTTAFAQSVTRQVVPVEALSREGGDRSSGTTRYSAEKTAQITDALSSRQHLANPARPGSVAQSNAAWRLDEYRQLVWGRENAYLTGSVDRFRLDARVTVLAEDLGLTGGLAQQLGCLSHEQRQRLEFLYTEAERNASRRVAAGAGPGAEGERTRYRGLLDALQQAAEMGHAVLPPSSEHTGSETTFERARLVETQLLDKYLVTHPEDVPARLRLRQLKLEQVGSVARGMELKKWALAIQPRLSEKTEDSAAFNRNYLENILRDPWLAMQSEAILRRQYHEVLAQGVLPAGMTYESFIVSRLSWIDLQQVGNFLKDGILLFDQVRLRHPTETIGTLRFAEQKCAAMLNAIQDEQRQRRLLGQSRVRDWTLTETNQQALEPILERHGSPQIKHQPSDSDSHIYLYQVMKEYEAAGVPPPPTELGNLLVLGLQDRIAELEVAHHQAKVERDRAKVQDYADLVYQVLEQVAPAIPPDDTRTMRGRLASVTTARGPPSSSSPRTPFDPKILAMKSILAHSPNSPVMATDESADKIDQLKQSMKPVDPIIIDIPIRPSRHNTIRTRNIYRSTEISNPKMGYLDAPHCPSTPLESNSPIERNESVEKSALPELQREKDREKLEREGSIIRRPFSERGSPWRIERTRAYHR